MPLYEYQCNSCGESFEKMVRFSDANQNPACPHCESKDTRKALSAFAVKGGISLSNSSQAASSCSSHGRFT